jgi:hypothetical protein
MAASFAARPFIDHARLHVIVDARRGAGAPFRHRSSFKHEEFQPLGRGDYVAALKERKHRG